MPEATSREKRIARRAREDIDVFIEFVFRVVQSEAHKKLQAHMLANLRAGVIAHKDFGKTTQALGLILFLLGNDPNHLIKLICADDDAAKDRIMVLRDHMDRNKRLHLVFPDLRKNTHFEDWGKYSLTVKRELFSKDSSIEAHGVLTAGEGERATIVLFDDVCNFQNTIKYPNYRALIKKAFKQIWIPLLSPDGRAIYLATKHHEDDLTIELEKNRRWKWVDFSVTGDPPVSPWPEKWTPERLLARLVDIGTIEFDRAYRNQIHSDAEQDIKKGWIQYFTEELPPHLYRVQSWDFGTSNDLTARANIGVDFENRILYIASVRGWEKLSYNSIIKQILIEADHFKPEEVVCENAGFQIVVGKDESLANLPIKLFTPTVSKHQRLRQTSVWYERHRIRFKQHACEEAILQITRFGKMKHDDYMDCVTQGILHIVQKLGKQFKPEDATASGPRVFTRPAGDEESVSDEQHSLGKKRVFSGSRFGNVHW